MIKIQQNLMFDESQNIIYIYEFLQNEDIKKKLLHIIYPYRLKYFHRGIKYKVLIHFNVKKIMIKSAVFVRISNKKNNN